VKKVTLFLLAVCVFSFSEISYAVGFSSFEEQVIEKQATYPSWYIGKGVVPGEQFAYHICDRTIKPTLNGATQCYRADLYFVQLLQDHGGHRWVVQASFTPDGSSNPWFAILHISENFATITTDGTSMNYAASLSHALLYLQKYANKDKPQALKIGSSWGLVDNYVSPVPQLTVDRFVTVNMDSNMTGVYEVGFEVVKDNVIYIKNGFPFPIEQTIYDSEGYNADPPILYQIKLLQTNNARDSNALQAVDMEKLCSNPFLYAQVFNTVIFHDARNFGQAQLPSAALITQSGNITSALSGNATLGYNTTAFDQNYVQPFNVTSNEEIPSHIDGNFTKSRG
jgi:hypothetical protein